MTKLNWTGVISKGILKLKLAFDADTCIADRMKIMENYAEGLSSNSDFSIIESHHYKDGSSLKAVINKKKS